MARRSTKSDLATRLQAIPLFATCSRRDLSAITGIVKEVDFEAGEVICREGDRGVGLHVVVEGKTKVQVGGRTVRRLGTGSFFGEIALLDGGPRSATVIAETPVKTMSIAAWNFRSILKSHPNLAVRMLEEVCKRLRSSNASLSH